jgi:hypothetical protein
MPLQPLAGVASLFALYTTKSDHLKGVCFNKTLSTIVLDRMMTGAGVSPVTPSHLKKTAGNGGAILWDR